MLGISISWLKMAHTSTFCGTMFILESNVYGYFLDIIPTYKAYRMRVAEANENTL
jgi:hypothetical protein